MSRQFDEQAYKKTWYCGSLDSRGYGTIRQRLIICASFTPCRGTNCVIGRSKILGPDGAGLGNRVLSPTLVFQRPSAGRIRGLEDLSKIPPYTVYDLRDSIARSPPSGDYLGIDFDHDNPMPLILQNQRWHHRSAAGDALFAAGSRGHEHPQWPPVLWRYAAIRPCAGGLSLGLGNGGFSAREGVWKYSGAIPIMTGSGTHTPTRRQIEIAKAWKTNFLIGFPAYVRHMGMVARDELKLDPAEFGMKGLLLHLGVDNRQAIEELWQAPVYDCYGTRMKAA